MRKFELDLVCAKDELRPAMMHVLVEKDFLVATDAHVMAFGKTDEILGKEFVKGMPQEKILIHREDWAKLKRAEFVVWNSENTIELVHAKKRNEIIKIVLESEVGKYPEWRNVVPNFEKPGGMSEAKLSFGLNAELLVKLQKAMDTPSVRLNFNTGNKAANAEGVDTPMQGIIMPVMKN